MNIKTYTTDGENNVTNIQNKYDDTTVEQTHNIHISNNVKKLLASVNIPTSDANVTFKELHIGNNVEEIGEDCFRNTDLSLIYCDTKIKKIGDRAFYDCKNLKSHLFIGDKYVDGVGASMLTKNGLDYLGTEAFYGCTKLGQIELGYVKSIGTGVYKNCTNVYMADVNCDIGEQMFYGCRDLQWVDIGENCTHIKNEAFFGCDKLSFVSDNKYNKKCLIIEDSAFSGCKKLEYCFAKPTSFGISSFCDCESLSTIYFDKCTSIGDSAFKNCNGITGNLNLLSVLTLGVDAFNGCSGITSIDISKSKLIELNRSFTGTQFTYLTIPSTITEYEQIKSDFLSGTKIRTLKFLGISDEDIKSITKKDWRFGKTDEIISIVTSDEIQYFTDKNGNLVLSKPHIISFTISTTPSTEKVKSIGCYKDSNILSSLINKYAGSDYELVRYYDLDNYGRPKNRPTKQQLYDALKTLEERRPSIVIIHYSGQSYSTNEDNSTNEAKIYFYESDTQERPNDEVLLTDIDKKIHEYCNVYTKLFYIYCVPNIISGNTDPNYYADDSIKEFSWLKFFSGEKDSWDLNVYHTSILMRHIQRELKQENKTYDYVINASNPFYKTQYKDERQNRRFISYQNKFDTSYKMFH